MGSREAIAGGELYVMPPEKVEKQNSKIQK
jgi:hypothetical protein